MDGAGSFGGNSAFGTDPFQASPFYNVKTMIDAVLRNTGHSTPSTEANKRLVVLNSINNRYAAICTSQHWDWLYEEVDLLLEAPEIDGFVNLITGSQDVVGIGTNWSVIDTPFNVLSVPSKNEVYMISQIKSNTEMQIEGRYSGPDSLNTGYKILRTIYQMPGDVEDIQSFQVDRVGEILPMGRQEFFRLKRTLPGQTGLPRIFTEIGRDENGVIKVEVYPAPDKNYTGRIAYSINVRQLIDDEACNPLVPDKHRIVLYYGALADMYAYLRDATMTGRADALFDAALMNMRNDTKLTDSKIQFQAQRNYKNRRLRRRSGRLSYSPGDFARED